MTHKTRIATALLLIFAVAATYALWIYAPCDDGYIYLVYVKNLLDGSGRGLTFNGENVQGFTSACWAGLLILVGVLPGPLPLKGRASQWYQRLFAIWATYFVGRRLGLSPGKASHDRYAGPQQSLHRAARKTGSKSRVRPPGGRRRVRRRAQGSLSSAAWPSAADYLLSDREIWLNQDFRRNYRPIELPYDAIACRRQPRPSERRR